MLGYVCHKCGGMMDAPGEHDTTAGCFVAARFVSSGPTTWGSEEARRLARYDEAIRLLRECTEYAGKEQTPGIDWWDVQIDEETMREALAFLASETWKEGEGGR